jgi:23S rRNA G2445 N2-methylase RlmL
MGISGSKRLVPYGLVLSTEETEERFYQIFKSFFDVMKKEARVIISDEDHALQAALKHLKAD